MVLSAEAKPVGRMSPGSHMCLVFTSEVERRTVLSGFVRDGCRLGHKILYFSGSDVEATRGWLFALGADVERAVEQGSLEVRPARQVYLDGLGRFDPGAAVARLQMELKSALAAGFPTLRVTGEMDWACRPDGVEAAGDLASYEESVRRVFHGSAVMAICQYDERLFVTAGLEEIVDAHTDGLVRADDYYEHGTLRVAPSFTPPGLSLIGELDCATSSDLSAVLSRYARQNEGDVHLDLSSLTFCDLSGLRAIVHLALRLAIEGRQVVLRHCPAQSLKLLHIAGFSTLPGLLYHED